MPSFVKIFMAALRPNDYPRQLLKKTCDVLYIRMALPAREIDEEPGAGNYAWKNIPLEEEL